MSGAPLWHRAAALAARCHDGQRRRDGRTPYVAHCFRVAMLVRDAFSCGDEVVLAAALLHDTIEDTPADYDDIAAEVGAAVADLVAAMTKDMRLPEVEREARYLEALAAAAWPVRLIKLADTLDNYRDSGTLVGGDGPERRSRARRRLEAAAALAEADPASRGDGPLAMALGLVRRELAAGG